MKKIDRSTLTVVRYAIPLCLSFLTVFGILFSAVFLPSLGWFSSQTTVATTGMHVVAVTEDCDVLVERRSEYDRTKGSPPIERYPGIVALKEYHEDDGYDVDTATSTAETPKLAFEMVNELSHSEYDDYAGAQIDSRFLMPGSYGTVTFYLRPFAGVTRLRKSFSLTIDGLYAVETQNGYEICEVSSQSTLDLLKGHILFFTERTGATHEQYCYDGLVDRSFIFDSAEHELCDEVGKTDCYKVVLYWEWPETYLDISRNTSDAENTRKYPSELEDYVSENPEFFFAINQASEDETERSEGYDDGDQKIGNHVHFVSTILTIS